MHKQISKSRVTRQSMIFKKLCVQPLTRGPTDDYARCRDQLRRYE